jgi:acetyltransferase
VRVSAAAPGGAARFAIRPYPKALEEPFDWRDRRLLLRPIRPDDELRHRAFLERVEPNDIRMRLFYTRRSIEHGELARLTQIDYEREMAFIAAAPLPDGGEETLGVVRVFVDPDNVEAEFGILLRSDCKGAGLGRKLMDKLVVYLKQRGTRRLVGTVLRENAAMLELAAKLGFRAEAAQADPTVRRIVMTLA